MIVKVREVFGRKFRFRGAIYGKKYFTQGLFFLYDVLPAITQQQNKEHFSFGRFFALGTI